MQTIGWVLRSPRVTRRCSARGCPAGTAATSRSLTIVSASSPCGVVAAVPIRARSMVASRTPSVSLSELSSSRDSSTPGWARWNAARASNSGVTVQPMTIPTVSRPRIRSVISPTAWPSAPAAPSAVRACSSAAFPAGVRVAVRAERSKSSAPSSRSSWRIWALMPDWLMCTRSAARVKFCSSATATKYSSCLSSITVDSSSQQIQLLDFWLTGSHAGGVEPIPQEEAMPEYEKAMRPEDITSLFVERSNAGDAAGVAALYEEDAVMAYPPGRLTVGRTAIRKLWEEVLAHAPHFTPEQPLPTLVSGDVVLTSTPPKDGAGARAQVVRRQPDGSWLRLLDQPEFQPPAV